MNNMIDVAIVILNHKMRALVENCLQTLFADITAAPFSVEVVVVDNASADGLLEWVAEKYPQVKTIQTGGNFGFARGVNMGLTALAAKYYFVLNPDTKFVEPKTIERLYDWMEAHPQIGMCSPRLINADGGEQFSCHRFPSLTVQLVRRTALSHWRFFKKRIDDFLLINVDRTKIRPVDWVQGSAQFVRAAAVAEVGLFDERFWMYYEDCDWCRRFWQAGWSIYFLPDITLMHLHGRGSAKVPGMIWPLFKNRLAREHLKSWALYFWKWRDAHPFKIV